MLRTRLCLLKTIALLATLVVARAQDVGSSGSKPDASNVADTLVRMHEAWGPKASTPKATLAIKESGRSGPVMKFRLIADGMPNNGVYSLLAWPVTQNAPSAVLTGVTLDGSGLAICAGAPGTCGSPDKPNDPIDLNLQPVPGEPVRLALVSADGMVKVFAKLVPIPLRGEDRGCAVEATLLTPGAELVLITGSGFPPNSDIRLDSESAGERHDGKGKADADGRFVNAILPYRQGVSTGSLNVKLKSSACAPSVKVPWGRRN